jgi:PAS domain S-box-containing protein
MSASDRVPELADPAFILERMDEAFYAVGPDWRLLVVNHRAEAFWGRRAAELLGRSMLELFPGFEGSPSYLAHRRAMETSRPETVETISTATGFPVVLHLYPGPAGLSVYFRDISDRREMERELEARNELLTLAEQSAGIGIWVQDVPDQTVRATPQFFHLLGIDAIDGSVPQELIRSRRHPDDRDRVTEAFRAAMASGAETFDSEYRIILPSGEERWIFGRGRVARDAEGRVVRYSGVDLDVTERKRAEAHARVVMGELVHRTNNLLTVVQSLAQQSARGATGIDDFLQVFGQRLQGLSQSTNLLIRDEWRGALLRDLIHSQIAPFASEQRFELDGPPARLSTKAVQNLGLTFHELCTNALKYGALSVPGGRVSVRWQYDAAGALHISWREQGGPPVAAPRRKGFGRVVAEQIISAALGASVSTQFLPEGLVWEATIPPSELAGAEKSS